MIIKDFQRTIRIETDFDNTATHHMQRDAELAHLAQDDELFEPILRLYSWKPFAISLGYQQSDEDIDKEVCEREGVDIIRRPTGGRAVYHSDELTYAVILRTEPSEGIYAVHNRISQFLLDSLQPLCGGQLALTSGRDSANIRDVYIEGAATNIACFASTSRHEITWNRKKVVGSAQRRFGNAVLQHGSILLGDEHLRLPEFLRINDAEKQKMSELLKRETATISDICGRKVSAEEVGRVFHPTHKTNEMLTPVSHPT